MPLVDNCNQANTFQAAIPAAPLAAGAMALAPMQGDHIFGDVLGVVGNGFQDIFGGGAAWQNRFASFDNMAAMLWAGQAARNLGHGNHEFISQTAGAPEMDRHAHMFGGYAARLRWQICEIVCVHPAGTRIVGRMQNRWKRQVMAALGDVFNNFVDETALQHYLANGNGVVRNAAAGVNHDAISLNAASAIAAANGGPRSAGTVAMIDTIKRFEFALRGILDRWPTTDKFWDGNAWQ